jgi:hypothetical protein
MLKGECPNCGATYYGWALRSSQYQTCCRCGMSLVIRLVTEENSDGVNEGYSPSTAKQHIIDTKKKDITSSS